MKDEYILALVLILTVGCFYYFAVRKPSLSVQLMDSSGNIASKGTALNPITSSDIQAVSDLLQNLLAKKAQQPAI